MKRCKKKLQKPQPEKLVSQAEFTYRKYKYTTTAVTCKTMSGVSRYLGLKKLRKTINTRIIQIKIIALLYNARNTLHCK